MQNGNAIIIKPSSLNYKISLRQAVEDFIKKEAKVDNFNVEIQEEQPELFAGFDELDDILFRGVAESNKASSVKLPVSTK